jgi:hypothetical protein
VFSSAHAGARFAERTKLTKKDRDASFRNKVITDAVPVPGLQRWFADGALQQRVWAEEASHPKVLLTKLSEVPRIGGRLRGSARADRRAVHGKVPGRQG